MPWDVILHVHAFSRVCVSVLFQVWRVPGDTDQHGPVAGGGVFCSHLPAQSDLQVGYLCSVPCWFNIHWMLDSFAPFPVAYEPSCCCMAGCLRSELHYFMCSVAQWEIICDFFMTWHESGVAFPCIFLWIIIAIDTVAYPSWRWRRLGVWYQCWRHTETIGSRHAWDSLG